MHNNVELNMVVTSMQRPDVVTRAEQDGGVGSWRPGGWTHRKRSSTGSELARSGSEKSPVAKKGRKGKGHSRGQAPTERPNEERINE